LSALWGSLASRSDLAVGARVVLEEAVSCLNVRACAGTGRNRLCRSSSRYGATQRSSGRPGCGAVTLDAVFLDPRATIHHVPEGLDAVLAALFVPDRQRACRGSAAPPSCAPVRQCSCSVPASNGLGSSAAARRLGAGRGGRAGPPLVTSRGWRSALALGADTVVNVDDQSIGEIVLDMTGGCGADVIVDTTPLSTSALATAVELAAVGGRIIVAGVKDGRGVGDRTQTRCIGASLWCAGWRPGRAGRSDVRAGVVWLLEPQVFEPFGGLTVGLDRVEDALLALGGEAGGDRRAACGWSYRGHDRGGERIVSVVDEVAGLVSARGGASRDLQGRRGLRGGDGSDLQADLGVRRT